MKTLWTLIVLLLAAALLSGQRPAARIELDTGEVLVAPVLRADGERIIVATPAGPRTIPVTSVVDIEQLGGAVPKARPAGSGDDVTAPPGEVPPAGGGPDTGDMARAGDPQDGSHGPGDGAPPEPFTGGTSAAVLGSGPDHHAESILQRYFWFVPASTGHRASVGAAFVLLFALVLQLSGRMAEIERATFGRCIALTTLIVFALAIQLSISPKDPWLLGVLVAVDLILWFAAVQVLMSAGFLGTLVMLASFVMTCLVGVVTLEIVAFVLQQSGVA